MCVQKNFFVYDARFPKLAGNINSPLSQKSPIFFVEKHSFVAETKAAEIVSNHGCCVSSNRKKKKTGPKKKVFSRESELDKS